jgi:membrane associated rhomboid family serine protease
MTLRTFRNALIVMGAFLALIWILQVVNWADGYRLDLNYGIYPDNISRLPDIFAAPFLHVSWQHIEGNSLPLFVLGVLAAYRSIGRFLFVSLIVAVTSGMAVWLFQSSHTVTVGASGLIFGYFGYVLMRGFFDRSLVDIGVGLVAGVLYWTILAVAIPGTPGVSWIGHVGGLVGGVLAAWLLRSAPPLRLPGRKPVPAPAGPGSTGPASPARKAGPAGSAGKSVDDLLRDLKKQGF